MILANATTYLARGIIVMNGHVFRVLFFFR